MTKNQVLTITAAATLVLAPFAFADSNVNTGSQNTITDNSGTGNVNTTVTTNSNNPTVSATGGNSSATGGSASATGGAGGKASSTSSANSRNTNTNRQQQGQIQGQTQKASSSVRASGDSSNSYVVGAQARNPVSTAFAAPLVAADDTCMGSSTAGGQGVGFGLSVGTTWHDPDCVRRKDARELYNMGQRKAALALLCQSDNVASAMTAAGTACPGRVEELSPTAGDSEKRARVQQAGNAPTDGVVYDYPAGVRRGW